MEQSMFDALQWRLPGPFRGGRVPAVAGHPTEKATFYFGACAGGVWKTTDGGAFWENISDGFFGTSAIGAIAIAPSDPNVIYVGTGETSIRGDVSHGDGVYKSTDGGQTWQHIGLSDTHAISTIRVHPDNADLVYVAALGHVWGTNEERGVFRSTDGGATWTKILYRSPGAGAIDLSMDTSNPRILYAAMWDAQRGPYYLRSGGPDSSIYRSQDGGDSWQEITRNPGLPTGILGKIGVAASPAQTGRVWALVEADDGALFRSDDGGETWQRTCDQGDLRRRAWYYTHIFADPSDADTVWVLNLKCWKSIDAGKTFTAIPTQHGDNQDLWIDPEDSNRMIEGNDGGANVTFNGGKTWSTIYNQPTAQFYHVTTDNRIPYRLYGSQQDNTAFTIPSSSLRGAITASEWFEPGGGESGYIAIKPDDNNIVYGGAIGSGAGHGRLLRFDQRTMETRIVTVWPEVQGMGRGAEDLKYRFQWTFPICFSPHDPNTLYATSNVVHRTTDDGMTWEDISPDLSRNDPTTLGPSGGPITKDNTGAETYGTIFAFLESPHERGVMWAGSDDGLLHLSRDGGANWRDVSIPTSQLPEWALISVIEQSPHDSATVYVAATRYKSDDFTPYLFKTNDYGQTWTTITHGIPANDFTRTIREDPQQRGLLFAGTETHVYISFDDGANWQVFEPANHDEFTSWLPVAPIYDLIIKDNDLVVATHGRSFWILDDISPLRQMAQGIDTTKAHFFQPATARRMKRYGRVGDPSVDCVSYGRAGGMPASSRQRTKPTGEVDIQFLDAGKNPPDGAIIDYWLPTAATTVTLTIEDGNGTVLRRLSSEEDDGGTRAPEPIRLTKNMGGNRFVWNLRTASARGIPGVTIAPDNLLGPIVVPGTYHLRLDVDGTVLERDLQVQADPRVTGTQEDLQAQHDLLLQIRDKLSAVHDAVTNILDIKAQVIALTDRITDQDVKDAGAALVATLGAIEGVLYQSKSADPRSLPSGLNDKLGALPGMISNADTRPPKQYYDVFTKLSTEADEQLQHLREVLDDDVKAFNTLVKEKHIDAIVL